MERVSDSGVVVELAEQSMELSWRGSMSDEQRAALRRHGYPDDLLPCGISAHPSRRGERLPYDGRLTHDGPGSVPWMRYRVCYLDGIRIDGHEGSDLDPGEPRCIHCGETDEQSASRSVEARLREAERGVRHPAKPSRRTRR